MALTQVEQGLIADGAVTINTIYGSSTASSGTFLSNTGVWVYPTDPYDQRLDTTSSVTFANINITSAATATSLTVTGLTSASTGLVINYNTLTGVTSYSSSNPFNQVLNTNSNVVFNSEQSTRAISAGGYPIDSNGQILVRVGLAQSTALMVSNYGGSSTRSDAVIRSYGQNLPSGTGSTSPSAALFLEGSRGTQSAPTAVQSGDTLWSISGGGYDGARWPTDINLPQAQIFATARETFAGNATTSTNGGAGINLRVQPAGVQLNSTSRQNMMLAGQSTGFTSSTSNINFINFGAAGQDAPTLTSSNGSVTALGWGATAVNFLNARPWIYGVPSSDPSPDNASLTATNFIAVVSGRRSGVSGRRNQIKSNDNLGGMLWYGQTSDNSTGIGANAAAISVTALADFTATSALSQLNFATTNLASATVPTNRLLLNYSNNSHRSASHTFSNVDNTANFVTFSSTGTILTNGTVIKDSSITGVSGTTAQIVDSFPSANFISGQYLMQIVDGTDVYSSTFNFIHNGTNIYVTENNILENSGALGTLTAAYNGANIEIRFAPTGATAMSIKAAITRLSA